jgi:hypothetical protein
MLWPLFPAVYLVLLHLKRTHSLGNFFRFLDNKPDAAALLQVYARKHDVELLRDFYYQDDRRTESACLALRESLAAADFGDRMAKIRSGLKSFNEDKERGFEAKVRIFLGPRRLRRTIWCRELTDEILDRWWTISSDFWRTSRHWSASAMGENRL